MELTINFDTKEISSNQPLNLGRLITELKKIAPIEWKDFIILITIVNYTSTPIIIKEYPYNPWWNRPDVYYTTSSSNQLNETWGYIDNTTGDTVNIEDKIQGTYTFQSK